MFSPKILAFVVFSGILFGLAACGNKSKTIYIQNGTGSGSGTATGVKN